MSEDILSKTRLFSRGSSWNIWGNLRKPRRWNPGTNVHRPTLQTKSSHILFKNITRIVRALFISNHLLSNIYSMSAAFVKYNVSIYSFISQQDSRLVGLSVMLTSFAFISVHFATATFIGPDLLLEPLLLLFLQIWFTLTHKPPSHTHPHTATTTIIIATSVTTITTMIASPAPPSPLSTIIIFANFTTTIIIIFVEYDEERAGDCSRSFWECPTTLMTSSWRREN